ncbi:MAG TPA: cytochrome c [Gammaproteobacteria bacterium]|nr:cytochrome c [Gammaproteobacteria bacterium]
MTRTAVLFAAAATWIVAGTSLAAGDAAAGKSKAASCGACHGPDGNSANPMWPKLAGQHAAYLVKQLKAFKSGERKDPLMSPMAAGLSENDMEDLAAFYASRKPR